MVIVFVIDISDLILLLSSIRFLKSKSPLLIYFFIRRMENYLACIEIVHESCTKSLFKLIVAKLRRAFYDLTVLKGLIFYSNKRNPNFSLLYGFTAYYICQNLLSSKP